MSPTRPRERFDTGKALQLLEREAQASRATGNPRIIDPIGETGEALISYIRFIADHTDAPILVDSPLAKGTAAGPPPFCRNSGDQPADIQLHR